MKTSNCGEDRYREVFNTCASERLQALCAKTRQYSLSQTKVTYCSIESQERLSIAQLDEPNHINEANPGVLIIENIDLEGIIKLGTRFGLSPFFFLDHASNPPGSTPWKAIFGSWSADHVKPTPTRVGILDQRYADCGDKTGWHVYGVVSIKELQHTSHKKSYLSDPNFLSRHSLEDSVYGWKAITCISYCRVNPDLYLFLVDAPITQAPCGINSLTLARAALKIPVSLNRGGLTIPQLGDQNFFSVSECLRRCLQHPWFFHVLFACEKDETARATCIHLSPSTIFHLIASSTWHTNIRMLEEDIQHVSFEEIRRPNFGVNNSLHNQRRELVYLQSQVELALQWIPDGVRIELDSIKNSLPASKYIGYPDQVLQSVITKAKSLERLLMDTFNLLLSSIGVLEAEASKKQIQQQQKLTTLAFVYVPLSFVTGVFGMNVKEINGSPLSIWVCFAALAIIGLCTAGVLKGYDWWHKRADG